MSELPNDWAITTLDFVADWGSGGTPSRKNPEFFNGTIPWIKTGELGDKYIRTAEEFLSEEAIKKSSARVFPKGSVGIAMYGATIGKASIWGIEASTNQACAVAQCKPEIIDAEFLYYFLLSEKQGFINAGKGGAQPNISQGVLKDWPIILPPLNEQKRIVAKIEELFSELDKGIESLKTARAQLKVYRQAVLKHAFEGKLTADWRENNKVSGEWKPVKLGEIIKVSSGKNLTAKQMREGSYPVYGGNGINGYHDEFNVLEKKLIIGRVGVKCGVTHITEEKCWVTDNALIVDFLVNNIDRNFFEKRLGYENLNKLSASTAQPVVSGSKIYSVEMLLPSFEEQRYIAASVDHFISVAEKIENTIDSELQKSEALRQSILKKAFSGQLIPQDPADEPASVLLERIRAEKIGQSAKKNPKEKRRAA